MTPSSSSTSTRPILVIIIVAVGLGFSLLLLDNAIVSPISGGGTSSRASLATTAASLSGGRSSEAETLSNLVNSLNILRDDNVVVDSNSGTSASSTTATVAPAASSSAARPNMNTNRPIQLAEYFTNGRLKNRKKAGGGPYLPPPPDPPRDCAPDVMPRIPEFTRRDRRVRPKIAIIALAVKRFHTHGQRIDQLTMVMRNITYRASFYNKLGYALRHGYDLILEDDAALDPSKGANPAWGKIRAIQKWLPLYEWILWIDNDAMIMKWSARIEDVVHGTVQRFLQDQARGDLSAWLDSVTNRSYVIEHNMDAINAVAKTSLDLVVSCDPTGLNTGVFFLRNTQWSHDLLNRIGSVSAAETGDTRYAEQDGFDYLLGFSNKTWRTRWRHKANRTEVNMDRSHVLVLNTHTWNSFWFGMATIFGRMPRVRYQWIYEQDKAQNIVIHMPACGYFRLCNDWVQAVYRAAICENGAEDAPFADYAPEQIRNLAQQDRVRNAELRRNYSVLLDAQIEEQRAQLQAVGSKKQQPSQRNSKQKQLRPLQIPFRGFVNFHWMQPAPSTYLPPDDASDAAESKATFPPLLLSQQRRTGGVQ